MIQKPAQKTTSGHQWIWQQPQWPRFTWDAGALHPLLREIYLLQGRLSGKSDAVVPESGSETELDALLQNIIESAAIEGEHPNAASVRSSLAKRLGVAHAMVSKGTARSEGLADLMLDAVRNYREPLTEERLFRWHRDLFPDSEEFRLHEIRAGALRGEEPMQVVSGYLGKPVIHFEAPPRQGLEKQLAAFLTWFDDSRADAMLDPMVRAGIAHLWFVTLHPFEDGNGRLARAVTDLALAQGEPQAVRFYAMSASIMEKRAAYYHILESTQKADVDISGWLAWFLETLKDAMEKALVRIDLVLQKARFWQLHGRDGLYPEQSKVLNRLLDAGPHGFDGGLSAAKYQSMANVSKATATRHLADLLEKKCLIKLAGGGRSTRYEINWP